MTTSNAMMQSLRVPPPAAQRDTRARTEGVNDFGGSASGKDKRGFEDLLAELAVEPRGGAADAASLKEPRAAEDPAAEAAALLSALKRGLIDADDIASDEEVQSQQDGQDAGAAALSSAAAAVDAMILALRPGGGDVAAQTARGEDGSDQTLSAQLLGAVADENTAGSLESAGEPVMPSSPEAVSLAADSAASLEDPLPMPASAGDSRSPSLAKESFAPGAPTTVTVIGQETHFAPVAAAPAAIEAARLSAPATANAPDADTRPAEGAGSDDGAGAANLDAEHADLGRAALASQDIGARDGARQGGGGGSERSAGETQGLARSERPGNADDGDGAKTEPARVLERGESDVRAASGPSPATQIARRVIAEALSAAAAAAAPAEAGGSETARGTLVRVLEIELEPASLGKVTIRMELKDDVLSLRIETAHREATVVIEKERDKLSNALKSAGYVVDAITAQTAEPQRASAQGPLAATGAQSSPFSSSQSQAGLAHSQGGGGQQHEAGRGENPPASRGINEGPENPSARTAGALYV